MSETSLSANVLLSLPEATLRTQSTPTTGTVYLQYINVAPPSGSASATSGRSVYLVVRLNAIEFPIDPSRPVARHITPDGTHVYTFVLDGQAARTLDLKGESVPVSLSLRGLPDPARIDAIETFDQILGQYAGWEGASGGVQQSAGVNLHEGGGNPETLRGRLVLMDEATGEMVGEVPHQLPIHEDPALVRVDEVEGAKGTAHTAPVVLELPPNVYDAYTGQGTAEGAAASELSEAQEIFVRAIPPDQQDWMTKSASLISRGIDSSTSLLVKGMSSASQSYIKRAAPHSPSQTDGKASGASGPPSRMATVLTHPTTHTALGYAHTATGHAARVSSKTVELVEGMIRRAVSGRQPSGSSAVQQHTPSSPTPVASPGSLLVPPAYNAYAPPQPPSEKPPLPPRRDGSKSPAPPLPLRPDGSKSPVPSPKPALTGADSNAPRLPLRTRDRLALSANLVLASVDESTTRLLDAGTAQLGAVVGHKYGPDAARSTGLAAGTARNVVLVYVDVRGFARRALIKKAGKEFVKGRVAARRG
ncbi:uncharacterized protein B0H18DRAFT_1083676 [Fomitopsis serialis]|uniref:uncharacterized protein n=1 Tax=Fomitopsis serialis TaxID=139415 RepID=UPI00200863ED|nr:uncharacterized protein B0H18DRAFT_1083676 [Neoantrodia serialis]KAH9930943.1 hypothetical protein B0H18DRAFT_1083676 [Neoantrodia serialis]